MDKETFKEFISDGWQDIKLFLDSLNDYELRQIAALALALRILGGEKTRYDDDAARRFEARSTNPNATIEELTDFWLECLRR